ncbi:MAG: glycosyltransferase [Synergistaceae bacterium]|jgi:GT2 family glycosyltransferase|nr:glycosyltransferase [Synergistaceae bacterium]
MIKEVSSCAAVIVAFEDPRGLIGILRSAAANRPGFIIVVDNSVDLANRAENERIANSFGALYLPQPQNIGSAGGFAVGMERGYRSGAEWVWLLDQDGLAADDCLEKLLENVQRGILCPAVEAIDGGYPLPDFRCVLNFWGGIVPVGDAGGVIEIALAGTHGILIHRDVMEAAGFYDGKRFFVGREDFDYSLRAARAGFGLWLVPDAKVFHPDLSQKSGLSETARSLRRIARATSRFTPQFLGFLRGNINPQAYDRRALMIKFNMERLSGFRLFAAVVYSAVTLFLLKLAGLDIRLLDTLKIYRSAFK